MTKTDVDYDPFTINFHLEQKNKWKSDEEFNKLRHQARLLSEEKAKDHLRSFGLHLPDSTLDKIWELSDQDKDGFLDRYEFTLAHHLLVRAYVYGDEIPDQVVISHNWLHL